MSNSVLRTAFVASVTVFGTISTGYTANLIKNGDFEVSSPLAPVDSFLNVPFGSSALTDWKIEGATGQTVSVLNQSYQVPTANPLMIYTPESGVQSLDLAGDASNNSEGISQVVTTLAGHLYQLSFFIGNNKENGAGLSSTVNVSVFNSSNNTTLNFTDTNAATNTNTINWQQFTHTFVGGPGTTEFKFLNGDPSTDFYNGFDNVVLLDVPEPGSLALFGMGLLGLALRRKLA